MTFALIVAAVALVVFIAAMIGPQVDDLRWREVHHEYWGLILVIPGALLSWTWLAWGGALLMADDAVQHAVQRFTKFGPSSRASLIHWLILKPLYMIPGVAQLDAWLNVHLQRFFMKFLP